MQRTVIFAVAVTMDLDPSATIPQTNDVLKLMDWIADNDSQDVLPLDAVSVVGVLDRGNPASNQNPQLFADYDAEQAAERPNWCF